MAESLLVLNVNEGVESHRETRALEKGTPARRVRALRRLGIDVLICGAISRPLESMLKANGIEVVPRICGEEHQVVQAFVEDHLGDQAFQSPGAGRTVTH